MRVGALAQVLPGIVWYGLQFGPLLLVGGVQAIGWIRSREQRRLSPRAAWVVLGGVALVALAALSSLWAADPTQTLRQSGLLALVMLFALTTYAYRWTTPGVLDVDVKVIFWTCTAIQALGVGGYFAGQAWSVGDYGRFVGVTPNANYAGISAAILVALSFAIAGTWAKVASIVPLVALVLSDSRGSMVGLILGIIVVLATVPDFRRSAVNRAWSVATIGALPLLFWLRSMNVFSALRSRASAGGAPGAGGGGGAGSPATVQPDVTSGRMDIYRHYFARWLENPILGTGYRSPQYSAGGGMFEAHNVYLSVLVELGLVGAVLFIALGVGMLRSAARHTVLIAAAVTALAVEVTESSLFGLGGPTALMSWLVLFAWAGTGLTRGADAGSAASHEPV
jgi:O-antigen ligase